MTAAEINALQAENFALKERVFGICKVYTILRPVLKFLKFFSFVKPGAKTVINAAIEVLDGACEIKSST